MKTSAKQTEKVYPSSGLHIAVLAQIIDRGTVKDSFGARRKVEFIMELPEETHVFDEAKGEQPIIVDRAFSNSISKTKTGGSALRQAIEGIKGAELEDEEFDLEELLGAVFQLNLSVSKDADKNGYKTVEIKGYMPLPKSEKRKFKPAGDSFVFDLDNYDEETFKMLPEWKRKVIAATDEFKALGIAAPVVASAPVTKSTPPPAPVKTGAKNLLKKR